MELLNFSTVKNRNLSEYLKKNGKFCRKINRNEKHISGRTYWSSYWSKAYVVMEINGMEITVKWQDGKLSTHMTSLDLRDYEIIDFP